MSVTTAEALAVVRNYIRNSIPTQPVRGFPAADANDALALIEERLREAEAVAERDKWWEHETLWKARAEKAEAERDGLRELNQQLTGRNQFLSTEQVRADVAEQRVAELEAALRELLASGIDDVDPRLGYVYIQADREAVEAARRALGGGE